MVTRKEKREREKGTNYFFEYLKIQKHFFSGLTERLKNVKDHRHQSYIDYGPEVLLLTVLLKNLTGLHTMRAMTEQFNKEECIENIKKALQLQTLEELPHYDTINNFLSGLDPTELETIRTYMIKELLKKRCFEKYRIGNRYWGVIVDGTGLHTFTQKHCDHCLRREYKDEETGETTVIYMHHVLETKLVVGDIVLSIASEFIENESEDTPKQDCELKAFKRLAAKLKQTFKRLPICLLGDSLYACEPVFRICDHNQWTYILRFKEGRIQSIADEYQAIKTIKQSEKNNKKNKSLDWVNDLSYHERTVNLLESREETETGERRQFVFITNIRIRKNNAQKLLNAGRSRWKIENEGFNNQKNVRYNLEHVNCHHDTAMKNHYLLTQIADILVQLYEKGFKLLKTLKKTIKEISSNLLEALRTRVLTDEDMSALIKPIQVRFT